MQPLYHSLFSKQRRGKRAKEKLQLYGSRRDNATLWDIIYPCQSTNDIDSGKHLLRNQSEERRQQFLPWFWKKADSVENMTATRRQICLEDLNRRWRATVHRSSSSSLTEESRKKNSSEISRINHYVDSWRVFDQLDIPIDFKIVIIKIKGPWVSIPEGIIIVLRMLRYVVVLMPNDNVSTIGTYCCISEIVAYSHISEFHRSIVVTIAFLTCCWWLACKPIE